MVDAIRAEIARLELQATGMPQSNAIRRSINRIDARETACLGVGMQVAVRFSHACEHAVRIGPDGIDMA